MKLAKHEEWRKGFPYYKVDWWDIRIRAWREIQKHHKSKPEAEKAASKLNRRTRIMVVYRDHREVAQ